MLARRCKLVHEAQEWELPLLVPSFSSKGAGFRKRKGGRLQSDVAGDLHDFGNLPGKALLVSAYDLHFGHLDLRNDQTKHTESAVDALRTAEIVFLDSGGYELGPMLDSSEPKAGVHVPREGFDEAEYRKVIKGLAAKRHFPCLVLTNFDHASKGRRVAEQVEAAKRLFGDFSGHMCSFILKPWRKRGPIDPDDLTDKDLARLRAFQIVGATDKDLGANLEDRLKGIACLRQRLDKVAVQAPLHIWGGLDPVITPLYFFAGAQIVDGISWLRYGYLRGVASAKDAYQVLHDGLGITPNRIQARGTMTLQNRTMLDKLAIALQSWVDMEGKDFSMFDPAVRDALRAAYKQMKARIKGV